MNSPATASRHGFTLVELLVVIAIIGVLVALLLPAVQAARESARRAQCLNQLKQVGLAIQNFEQSKKVLPTGRNGRDQFSVSWAYFLLPYVEQQNIFDAYDPNSRVDSPANARAMRAPIQVYTCPSRRSPAADRDFDNDDDTPLVLGAATAGDYAANAGLEENTGMEDSDFIQGAIDLTIAGPMFSGSKILLRQVTDGLSQTIAVGERHIPPVDPDWGGDKIHFRQGDNCFLAGDSIKTILRGTEDGLASGWQDDDDDKFGSAHPQVTLFVFLDGHTEAISNDRSSNAIGVNPTGADDINIDPQWLWLGALSTVAGAEIIEN